MLFFDGVVDCQNVAEVEALGDEGSYGHAGGAGAGFTGCGSGKDIAGSSGGTYAGNYNAVITATSGSVVHTTMIQVGLLQ